MTGSVTIRAALPEDAGRFAEIYRYYVEETAVSFEYEAPGEREMRRRMERTLEFYPYLAAELDGVTAGYAYAGRFSERAAYDWDAEASVYVDCGLRRAGVGRALYEALERALADMNVLNLYAAVAVSPVQDGRCPDDSLRFHERMGFEPVGRFARCGFKFGRWYDLVWLQKRLGGLPQAPEPVVGYPELGAGRSM